MKERIQGHFDQNAETYNDAAHLQKIVAKSLARRLPEYPTHSILEIGCGTGLFTRELLVAFPRAELTLVDIAPNMIAQCQQQISPATVPTWLCGDVETLVLPRDMDLIASSMTLHWVDHLSATIEKLISHLASNGHLVCAFMGSQSFPEWRKVCLQAGVETGLLAFPDHTKLQKVFPQGNYFVETRVQHYPRALAFLQSLKKIGAHTPIQGYRSLSIQQLRRLLQLFDQIYPEGAAITYEIIYLSYQKS